VSGQNRSDDAADADQHDDALDEIIPCRGHVAAEQDIDAGEAGHQDDADDIRNVESHAEKF